MTTDEEFARELRERALAAAPRSAVDLDAVMPRARRRRARRRAGGVGGLAVVAVTGVLAAQAWAGGPGVVDVGPAATGPLGRTATASPGDGVPPEAEAEAVRLAAEEAAQAAGADLTAADEPGESGTAQGAAPYWYVLVETPAPDGGTARTETWRSRTSPGLAVSDGDLTAPVAVGPADVVGRLRIDGARAATLSGPTLLPTDVEGLGRVLRDSVEPDRTTPGGEDDAVFLLVQDVLRDGGVLPTDLLRGVVEVAGSLPGATVSAGTDSRGRPGVVVAYTGSSGRTDRLVVDPVSWLPLQVGAAVYVEQHPAEDLPVEPTPPIAGCASPESC